MHEIKRSKLHKIDVMSWLNKTHGKTASDSYKFLPEDLIQRQELENLFNQFDQDKSDALDYEEYGFFITREELHSFFRLVDQNGNNSLGLDEFQACMLDQNAKEYFTRIMKKLVDRSKRIEDEIILFESLKNISSSSQCQQQKPSPVMPLSFMKIINLMTYLNQREELKKQLQQQNVSIASQIPNLKSLIDLSSMIDMDKKALPKEQRKLEDQKFSSSDILSFKKEIKQLKQKAVETGLTIAESNLRSKFTTQNIRLQEPESRRIFTKFHQIKNTLRNDDNSERRIQSKLTQLSNDQFKYTVPEQLESVDNNIWKKIFTKMEKKDLKKIKEVKLVSRFAKKRKQSIQDKIESQVSHLKNTLHLDCSSLKYQEFSKTSRFHIDVIKPQLNSLKNSQFALPLTSREQSIQEENVGFQRTHRNQDFGDIHFSSRNEFLSDNLKKQLLKKCENSQQFSQTFFRKGNFQSISNHSTKYSQFNITTSQNKFRLNRKQCAPDDIGLFNPVIKKLS